MGHNRMQEAVDRLACSFREHASNLVTYSRGTNIIGNIPATVGRTLYDVVQGEVMTSHESRDYLINNSDMFFNGVQMVPMSGDLITDDDGRVYQVSIPKPFNLYERIGPNGSMLKIHTVGPMSFQAIPPLPLPPVITSPATLFVNGYAAIQITATNNPTSFGAAGLPTGLTIDPASGLISGTSTTAGIYVVIVSATNAYGTGSKVTSLYVTSSGPDNSVPHFYSAAAGQSTFPITPQPYDMFYTDANGVRWSCTATTTTWVPIVTQEPGI